MRNKLGLVQIKVRAKDSSTIDLSSFTIDDLEITGNIEDAKGGKLIAFDVYISDENDEQIIYKGVTFLAEETYILVLAQNTSVPTIVSIYYDGTQFNVDNID